MSAATLPETLHPKGRTLVRWRILGLLVLSGFIAYILRTNMSVAGVDMMRELGLTQLQLGWVFAAFNWGYGLFQFPGGVVGGRLGARRALTLMMAAWGVLNVMTGLVPATSVTLTLAALFLVRFAMGVTQAPLYPVLTGEGIARWFPPDGWAFPNGLSTAGNALGAAVTGPLVVWLVLQFGWRGSFIATAPLALGAAAVWWWYGRDRPADHPAVGVEELAFIESGRSSPPQAAPGDWVGVLRDRNVLLLTASYFCMNYVFYIFFNWFFIYLVEVRGFAMLEGGVVAALPWIAAAVGGAAGGGFCDWLTRRHGICLGCRITAIGALLIAAILLFGGATASSAWLAIAFLSLCFAFVQFTDGAYWAATTAAAGPNAAAACGVLNTGGNVVGGFGALLVPLMAQAFGWVAALSTGSVFAVLAAGLWLLVRLDRSASVHSAVGC
jgi:ACS family glucarate transporter-like MFS transporter